jgi:geranylgeranyl reductase family protein
MERPSRVVVVGAGPAGSLAAWYLASHGVSTVLVDRSDFPRDKACGDVVGPQALATLEAAGFSLPGSWPKIGSLVLADGARSALLPAEPGLAHPGHGLVVPRRELDQLLRDAALAGGAGWQRGRAHRVRQGAEGVLVEVEGVGRLEADAVIGADGALSAVARASGLVTPHEALWGFALRCYVRDVELDADRVDLLVGKEGLPSYGWAFRGPGSIANVGVGVGLGPDRGQLHGMRELLDDYLATLGGEVVGPPLGGWLRMGGVGVTPARGRVLLVGDAAGLVNPLQGEGIWAAVGSGLMAARFIVELGAHRAAPAYTAWVRETFGSLLAGGVGAHRAALAAPRVARVVAALGLAWAVRSRTVAAGIGAWVNALADSSGPGLAPRVARFLDVAGAIAGSLVPPGSHPSSRAVREAATLEL